MGQDRKTEVKYYYDSHSIEEDLLGEPSIHSALVHYLHSVLEWQFRGQPCVIHENLNFYHTSNPQERPLAPDLAVIKGTEVHANNSWTIGSTGPAPKVVIEIASFETSKKDIEEKPIRFALMGIEEYFFYDPDDEPPWRPSHQKLFGWRWNKATGELGEIVADEQGRLWSQHLDSFLAFDESNLQLHESSPQRRLTGEEALAQENEKLAQKIEALAQKLRSLGVNPDELVE